MCIFRNKRQAALSTAPGMYAEEDPSKVIYEASTRLKVESNRSMLIAFACAGVATGAVWTRQPPPSDYPSCPPCSFQLLPWLHGPFADSTIGNLGRGREICPQIGVRHSCPATPVASATHCVAFFVNLDPLTRPTVCCRGSARRDVGASSGTAVRLPWVRRAAATGTIGVSMRGGGSPRSRTFSAVVRLFYRFRNVDLLVAGFATSVVANRAARHHVVARWWDTRPSCSWPPAQRRLSATQYVSDKAVSASSLKQLAAAASVFLTILDFG